VADSKTARQLLLTATGGIHTGKGEKVYYPEISGDLTAPSRKSRSPLQLDRQEGMPVELQQPDDDFAHYAAADRPQMQAAFHDLGFLQDIVPKRRRRIEILVKSLELAQVLPGQGWPVHGFGDALAGRELPGDVKEQVSLRQGGRAAERRDRTDMPHPGTRRGRGIPHLATLDCAKVTEWRRPYLALGTLQSHPPASP
jgi:hypothetical protein